MPKPSALQNDFIYPYKNTIKLSITLILQKRKLRHRKVKQPDNQGYNAN